MKLPNNSIKLFLFSFVSLILLFTAIVSAEDLELEKAIELGLINNKEINNARKGIQQLERNLERINISQDWQLSFNGEYSHDFNGGEGRSNYITVEKQLDGGKNSANLGISASKSFFSGLNLSPRISIDEDVDTSFSISISQPLYPQLPTESARNYNKMEKELIKAHRNYKEVKVNSILSWLNTYLNINRMNDKQDIYMENLRQAEDNLVRVLEREKIGDAGKNEILAAELSLENARYSLLQAENELEDIHFNIANQLGFSTTEELIITDKNQYLDILRDRVEEHIKEYLEYDRSALMIIVEKNNNQLQEKIIDRVILEQELEWLKKSNDPNLDLTGSYGTANDDLTVGLSLSYHLYDGGLHKMNLEDKEKEVTDNLTAYDDLYNQLNQELKQNLDKLELSEMALKRGELNLARSQHELEVAGQQLDMGLIDYLEYQDKWITAAEAEINIASSEAQLFINRLEFIKFLDIDLLDEIIGGF